MEFPPLEETDYMRLGFMHGRTWKKAKDREFCLSALDEKRLAVIGLPDPGRRFNSENFRLKNHLSFGLRFSTLRKCLKMRSQDIS